MTNQGNSKRATELIGESVPPVAAAAASIAAILGHMDPAAAIVAALAADRSAALLTPSIRRRLDAFSERLFRPTQQEFWKRVTERKAAQEAWYTSTDRLRSLVDPAVASVLGALVGEYVEADRMPDGFFRDASSLLVSIQHGEWESLVRLLGHITTLPVDTRSVRCETSSVGRPEFRVRFSSVEEGRGSRSYTSTLNRDLVCDPAVRQGLRLLGQNGLAEGPTISNSGELVLHVDVQTAARIASLA
jgi:hypothetical protein